MEISVFLGAEGCAEVENEPWVREADHAACEEMRLTMGERWNDMIRDGTGRPYFLVFVSDKAPPAVWERANARIRLLRLRE